MSAAASGDVMVDWLKEIEQKVPGQAEDDGEIVFY
jgi:hypothetical protein